MTWIKGNKKNQKAVLTDYWQWRARGKLPSVRSGGPCEWCQKFKPLNFTVCMNCGAKLNEK